jgi:hypothetical protein
MTTLDSRRAAASHEAGHVVLALEADSSPVKAWIMPGTEGWWWGCTNFDRPADPYAQALIGVAGVTGEVYDRDPYTSPEAIFETWRDGRLIRGASQSDMDLIDSYREPHGLTTNVRATVSLIHWALLRLHNHSDLFEQVRNELLERGYSRREYLYDFSL